MKRLLSNIFLILIIFLVGCGSDKMSGYDDSDIAALVRGEELTIGDLRFLYPDDKILENLEGTIKAKLVEQEVKEMNLDVSQKSQEIRDEEGLTNTFLEENHNQEFTSAQATKLEIESEEYIAKYIEKTQEMTIYLAIYVEEKIGKLNDFSESGIEEYNYIANGLLDELIKENEQEIQRFVK